MSGILKIYDDYTVIEASPVVSDSSSAVVSLNSEKPAIVTALIIVNGEVVDYKSTDDVIINGTLNIEVPEMYKGQPYSIFVFSAKNRYSNKDIGKSIWGVWFQTIKDESVVSFGNNILPKGALLMVVRMEGAGFKLHFTRLGDSTAGHGEVVSD